MTDTTIRKGKGVGYYDTRSDRTCMIRCFECGRENWAVAVSSGQCSWCGYNPNVPVPPEPPRAA